MARKLALTALVYALIGLLLGMVTMAIVFVRNTRVVRADPGITAQGGRTS